MRCKFYVCYGSRFNARTGTRPCAPRPSARTGTPRCSIASSVRARRPVAGNHRNRRTMARGLPRRRTRTRCRRPNTNTHTLVQPRAPCNRRRSSGTRLLGDRRLRVKPELQNKCRARPAYILGQSRAPKPPLTQQASVNEHCTTRSPARASTREEKLLGDVEAASSTAGLKIKPGSGRRWTR